MSVRTSKEPGIADYVAARCKHEDCFLDEIDHLIGWTPLEKILRQKLKRVPDAVGNPAYPPLLMFKIFLLQRWYNLSDATAEEALCDCLSFVRFTGLSLDHDEVPDATTIRRFRQSLVERKILKRLLDKLKHQLERRGLLVREGAIVDASVVSSARRPIKVLDVLPEDHEEQSVTVLDEVEVRTGKSVYADTVCLVTGCAGFIGSHLVERLLSTGRTVIGVDNYATGHRRNMAAFTDHPAFTFLERDIRAPGLIEEVQAASPDLACVFHLAAIVSVPFSIDHPRETMSVNWEATVSLHAAAQKSRLPAFVFAGSAAEYGEVASMPIAEDVAAPDTVQQSPYGLAKFLASTRIKESGYGTSLRCFNVYGPRQDAANPYSGVISRFVEAGLSGKPLTIFGDGRQTRDFVAVADVVDGYLLAAGLTERTTKQPLTGIYNLGTGRATSILELADRIGRLTKNTLKPVFMPSRQGDIRDSVADGSKFAAVGFSLRISLEEGLKGLIQWQREELPAKNGDTTS